MPNLAEQLAGAKVIEIDEARDLYLAWHGGHGIHVYEGSTGTEVDYLTTGDWSKNEATESQIRKSMRAYITVTS